jgi:hypothetical protein
MVVEHSTSEAFGVKKHGYLNPKNGNCEGDISTLA